MTSGSPQSLVVRRAGANTCFIPRLDEPCHRQTSPVASVVLRGNHPRMSKE